MSESNSESYTFYDKFEIDDEDLPEFINTVEKWRHIVYTTDNMDAWRDLVLDIEEYYNPHLSKEDRKILINSLAEDIICIHGIASFFPPNYCMKCEKLH